MVEARQAPVVLVNRYGQRRHTRLGDPANPRDVEQWIEVVTDKGVGGASFGGATYGYVTIPYTSEGISALATTRNQDSRKPLSIWASTEYISAVTRLDVMDSKSAQFISDPDQIRRRCDNLTFLVVPTDSDNPLIPEALRNSGHSYTSLNVISFTRSRETGPLQTALLSAVSEQQGIPINHAIAALASFNQSGVPGQRRGIEMAETDDAIDYAVATNLPALLIGPYTGMRRRGSFPMMKYSYDGSLGWSLYRQGNIDDDIVRTLMNDLPHHATHIDGEIVRNHDLIRLPNTIRRLVVDPDFDRDLRAEILSQYYSTGYIPS